MKQCKNVMLLVIPYCSMLFFYVLHNLKMDYDFIYDDLWKKASIVNGIEIIGCILFILWFFLLKNSSQKGKLVCCFSHLFIFTSYIITILMLHQMQGLAFFISYSLAFNMWISGFLFVGCYTLYNMRVKK